MKVLEVYKDVFPEVSGGIERYVHDLSMHLKGSGHSVRIIVAGGGSRSVDGIDVTGVPCMGRILSNPVAPGYHRFLGMNDADVVHFHVPLPTAVLSWELTRKSRRKPYVVTYHSDIVRQAFAMPVYRHILHRFLSGAEKVLVTSEKYRDSSPYLKDLHNVEVVPIGVDLKQFRPDPLVSRKKYLFVGRFRKYKGIFVLLNSWRAISAPPGLVLVGGGRMKKAIMDFVGRHSLPVVVKENLSDEELLGEYQRAKALILPSIQRSEAFGMVQLEAMACGTAVISSDLPTGVSWVNKHGETGFLFPPGDSKALSEAVLSMENSESVVSKMGLNARKRVEDFFDSTILLGKVENCLKKAAGS